MTSFFSDILNWLKANKEASETLKNLATVVAIVFGGTWTWLQLRKRREFYPHCKLDHTITNVCLSKDANLLRVTVQFTNVGKVLVRLSSGFTWVQQISPITGEIQDCIKQNVDPVKPGETETQWPLIGERKYDEDIEIEPDETESLISEFKIDSNVREVLIYSHFVNPAKQVCINWLRRNSGKGWHHSTIFSLSEEAENQTSETPNK
jgi:hypothetical protein